MNEAMDSVAAAGAGAGGDLGPRIAFYVLAALVLGGAIATVTRKNSVTAVMSLVGTFFALAALYTLLSAQFIATVQVLVYAGAIMTLFVFVVMLLNRDEYELLPRRGVLSRAVGGGLALGGMAWVAVLLARSAQQPPAAPPVGGWGGVASVGEVLFRGDLFAFEAISLMLLVAVIGAVVVARIPRKRAQTADEPNDVDAGASPRGAAHPPGGHA